MSSHYHDEVEDLYDHHITKAYNTALKLPGQARDKMLALVRFAETRRLVLIIDSAPEGDVWGFGRVPKILESLDGSEYWTHLDQVCDPTGLTYQELRVIFETLHQSGQRCVARLLYGERQTMLLVSSQFLRYVLANHSPWANEFNSNIVDLIILERYDSGMLDDTYLTLAQINDDNSISQIGDSITLRDYVEVAGLPPREEAVQKAFRGVHLDLGEDA